MLLLKAAGFIGSLDNILGEVVAAAVNGCMQCHGSTVKYKGEGKFDASTWPNSGIGRPAEKPCWQSEKWPL